MTSQDYRLVMGIFINIFNSVWWEKNMYWNFRTIYGGKDLSRNKDVVPAHRDSKAGGID
jgi:hypothetical protein